MNEVINSILSRRSIRKFSDKPVPKEDIITIINVGMSAPSGQGKNTWEFIAVTNADKIKELAPVVGRVAEKENYDFYNPVALIITTNEKTSIWGKEDNACAMQNMALAAHSMGIGSVWINQMNYGKSDDAELRALLAGLGVKDDHTVYGVLAIGYDMNKPRGIVEKKGTYKIVE